MTDQDERYPGSKQNRRERAYTPEYVPDPWRDNYTDRWVGGEKIRLYPIGAFAEAVGVSVQTIRSWEAKSQIPLSNFRLPSNMVVRGESGIAGRRLYTEDVIDATVEVLRRRGLLGSTRIAWTDDLTTEIHTAWMKARQQRRNGNAD